MKLNNKAILFGLLIGLAVVAAGGRVAWAVDLDPTTAAFTQTVSSYRQIMDLTVPARSVPTVMSLPVSAQNLERSDFLVYDRTSKSFEPSLLLTDRQDKPLSVSIVDLNSNNSIFSAQNTVDHDESTFADIGIVGDQVGKIRVTISRQDNESITTTALYLLLDTYVALPKTISIKVGDDQKTVLATSPITSPVIHFPRTTARRWTIDLTYGQPLRLTEIKFGDQAGNQIFDSQLRFLSQPGHEYSLYLDPDRRVTVRAGEMGNLADNDGVVKLTAGVVRNNPDYIIADTDKDGIPDVKDNCVSLANADQVDVNNNGRGDVCDDFDKDGIINSTDNCPALPNYNQQDTDGDKIGDVCDGEESRITEKYKWLPWVGLGAAGLVVIGLFVLTAVSMRKKPELEEKQNLPQ